MNDFEQFWAKHKGFTDDQSSRSILTYNRGDKHENKFWRANEKRHSGIRLRGFDLGKIKHETNTLSPFLSKLITLCRPNVYESDPYHRALLNLVWSQNCRLIVFKLSLLTYHNTNQYPTSDVFHTILKP